jgi:hypothetical protein
MTQIILLPAATEHKVKNISMDPLAICGSHQAQLTAESFNFVNTTKDILARVLNFSVQFI